MWSFARPSETRSNRSSYFNRTRGAIFCPHCSAAFFPLPFVLFFHSLIFAIFPFFSDPPSTLRYREGVAQFAVARTRERYGYDDAL